MDDACTFSPASASELARWLVAEANVSQKTADVVAIRLTEIARGKAAAPEPDLASFLRKRGIGAIQEAYVRLRGPTETTSDLAQEFSAIHAARAAARGMPAHEAKTYEAVPKPIHSFPLHPTQAAALVVTLDRGLRGLLPSIYDGNAGHLTDDERYGAFLISAIIHSGVLMREELAALAHALKQPLFGSRSFIYAVIELRTKFGLLMERRRSLLAPLTAALAIKPWPENYSWEAKLGKTARKGLKAISVRLGLDALLTLQDLAVLREGMSALMRTHDTIPQFVVDYCEGAIRSTSLPEHAWRRILGLAQWPDMDEPKGNDALRLDYETTTADQPDEDAAEDDSSDTGQSAADSTLDDPIKALRACLRGEKDRRGLAERLHAFAPHAMTLAERHPIVLLLHQWCLWLATGKLKNGQEATPNFIREAYGALGYRILAVAGSSSREDLLGSDFLIETASEAQVQQRRRAVLLRACDEFAYFLLLESGVPVTTAQSGQFDLQYFAAANLIMHSEYLTIRALLLADSSSPLSPHWRPAADGALSMGFGLGLRLAEAFGLACRDLCASDCSLRIQKNEFGRLKTPSANRLLPLQLLIAEAMENLIGLRVGHARREPLFREAVDPSCPIKERAITPKLVELMRDATGDPSLHFHHLRHSFATWLVFSLVIDSLQLGRFANDLPFMKDLPGEKAVRAILFPGESGSLHDIHQVRELLGHFDEATSFAVYIHLMEVHRYAAVTLLEVDPDQRHSKPEARLIEENLEPWNWQRILAAGGLTRDFRRIRRAQEFRQEGPENRDRAAAIKWALDHIEQAYPDRVQRLDEDAPAVDPPDREADKLLELCRRVSSSYLRQSPIDDQAAAAVAAEAGVSATVLSDVASELHMSLGAKLKAMGAKPPVLDALAPQSPSERSASAKILKVTTQLAAKGALDAEVTLVALKASWQNIYARGSGYMAFRKVADARAHVAFLTSILPAFSDSRPTVKTYVEKSDGNRKLNAEIDLATAPDKKGTYLVRIEFQAADGQRANVIRGALTWSLSLAWILIEASRRHPATIREMLRYEFVGHVAHAYLNDDGTVTVLAGSHVRIRDRRHRPAKYFFEKELDRLMASNALMHSGSKLHLQMDTQFSGVSAAASFCNQKHESGTDDWRYIDTGERIGNVHGELRRPRSPK